MKVLQINSVCGYGSTGRIATELYNVLEEQGHECVIAYGRGTAPEGYKTIKIGSNLDNYLHVAKTRIFDKHGFGSTKATEEFIKKVEEYNPDVIHLHNIHGYYINIEVLFDYLKKADKKVIWTLHDCWAFTGHCSYFDYVGCDKWKKGCNNCPQKSEYPTSNIIDNSDWNYQNKKKIFTAVKDLTIITPSKWLADVVRMSFLGEYEIKIVRNGIDMNTFKPVEKVQLEKYMDKYNKDNKHIILGVANVWDARKGLNDFISLSKVVDKETLIILVGLSRKQISMLPANIKGVEKTSDINELVALYSMASVFVNTSVEESFGLVTIEAMACGVQVVGYNSTATPELICENNGIVVEKNNINAILEAIDIIKNRDKESHFKEYISLVRELYCKEKIYNEYISIYEKHIEE